MAAAAGQYAMLGVARLAAAAHDRALRLARDVGLAAQLPAPAVGNNAWVGLRDVGSGGYGSCALFGSFDAQGNLQERMVVKETWCTGQMWYDPVQWDGPYTEQGFRDYNAGIRHVNHMENVLHRRVDGVRPTADGSMEGRRSPVIVRFLGSSLPDPVLWNFRTYVEYCPYETLGTIIAFYSNHDNFERIVDGADNGDGNGEQNESEEEELTNEEEYEDHTMSDTGDDMVRDTGRVRRRYMVDVLIPGPESSVNSDDGTSMVSEDADSEATSEEDGPDPIHLIPEPFIWYIFDSLARAAQIMQNGHDKLRPTADERVTARGWRQIVHRDIKLDNVFLQDPPTTPGGDWKLYPRPVLGDFGLAIETGTGDPNNPRAYRDMGTPGYLAPEQATWVHRTGRNGFDSLVVDGVDVFRLDSHTNVWQIGMVIYCLIHRIADPVQVQYYSNADYDEIDADAPRRRGRRRAASFDPTQAPRREPWRLEIPGYSPILIDLIHRCLSMDPSKRPTLDNIRSFITPRMGLDPDRELLGGMRRLAPKAGQPWYDNDRGRQHGLLMRFEDDYRIGLAQVAL